MWKLLVDFYPNQLDNLFLYGIIKIIYFNSLKGEFMKSEYERTHMTVFPLLSVDIITCSDTAPVTDTEPIILPIHPFTSSN